MLPVAVQVGLVTVRVITGEVTIPIAAVILLVPVAIDVASPLEPVALLIEATLELVEPQVAEVVRFCVELSV